MKNLKNILFSVIAITVFLSCEEDVTNDVTLNSIERLVIEGGIERNSNSTFQAIRLTKTLPFLTNTPNQGVLDAVVTVSDGVTTWNFTHSGNGNYSNNNLLPEIGKTYTITIIWNNETYVGSDTLNQVPLFDNFYYELEEETLFTDEGFFIKFDSTDPIGVENYYYYRVFKNNVYTIVPDPGNNQTLIVSDEFFDGQQRIGVNPNEEVSFKIGDLAKAQQLGISKRYYQFLFELFTQTGNQGISFVGNPPPASIRSNIINITNPKNRILGYFYAVDIEEDSVVIQ
ncbi:MAG: DUF4249 domain-containing protein [Flavobacterium sp.]|nr:DUF4249 domain-containing protein [Flavobacterium sp.]